MDIYQNLKTRFKTEWINRTETAPFLSVIGRAEGVSKRAAEATIEARNDNRLTPAGKIDATRAKLAGSVAPLARDLIKSRDEAPARAAAQRRSLLAAAVKEAGGTADTTSAVAIRAELRAHVRGLAPGAALAMLTSEKMPQAEAGLWAAALLEVPPSLVGMTPDDHRRIVDALAGRLTEPAKLAAVASFEAAAELAALATSYAMREVMAATGLQPATFVAWAVAQGAPAEAFDPALVAAAERQGAAVTVKAGGVA